MGADSAHRTLASHMYQQKKKKTEVTDKKKSSHSKNQKLIFVSLSSNPNFPKGQNFLEHVPPPLRRRSSSGGSRFWVGSSILLGFESGRVYGSGGILWVGKRRRERMTGYGQNGFWSLQKYVLITSGACEDMKSDKANLDATGSLKEEAERHMTREELADPLAPKLVRLLYFVSARFICTVGVNKWRELQWKSLSLEQQKQAQNTAKALE